MGLRRHAEGLAADNPAAEPEIHKVSRSLTRGVELWVGGDGRLNSPPNSRKKSWIRLRDFTELERHLIRLGARY